MWKWAASWQPLCPAKTQISLGICPVWLEPSLCTVWVASDPRCLHVDSEAQADMSLHWSHRSFYCFCHDVAQIFPHKFDQAISHPLISHQGTIFTCLNALTLYTVNHFIFACFLIIDLFAEIIKFGTHDIFLWILYRCKCFTRMWIREWSKFANLSENKVHANNSEFTVIWTWPLNSYRCNKLTSRSSPGYWNFFFSSNPHHGCQEAGNINLYSAPWYTWSSEPQHDKTNKMACAPSLFRVFAVCSMAN